MRTTERPLSSMWKDAKLSDIGSGFRSVTLAGPNLRNTKVKQQVQEELLRRLRLSATERKAEDIKRSGTSEHKFLLGNSPFFHFTLRVNMKKVAAKAKSKKPKVDIDDNPLSDKQKKEFAKKLGINIDSSADFIWKEILPVTNSMLSAVKRIDDYSNQLVDEGAGLPVKFMIAKMQDAAQLRMIRHIGDQFKLTAEERKLLSAEFYARLRMFGQ